MPKPFARIAVLLAAVLPALLAAPAFSQQFPAQQRGLTADTAYSSGELATGLPLKRFSNPRQVEFGHTLGFLTQVDGFAPRISYQLAGMLHQVDYASGASWTQNYNPADHLPRPYNITLAGVSAPFATGNYGYDGESHVSQIGSLLFRFDRLGRLVRGDVPNGAGVATQTFARVNELRKIWVRQFARDVEADQIRPKAEEAWHNKDYARAAELYLKIRESLSPVELKKPIYAEKQVR